jgi:hypothetical protein
MASVTTEPPSPYSKTSSGYIYYAASGVAVDSNQGFHDFTLSATTGADDLIYLDVSSSKSFGSLAANQDVVITVTVAGLSIPLAQAGLGSGVSDCSNSQCQALSSGKFYAAKYPISPAAQKIRVGFYIQEICTRVTTLSGACSGGVVQTPVLGTPVLIPVKVYVGIEDTDGSEGKISDTEDNASLTLSFQGAAPLTGTCPSNLNGAFFPADSELSWVPSFFSGVFSATSGAAPISSLVVLAKDGAAPGAIDDDGQITARVSSSTASVISGFTNTTNGSDHLYQVSVGARDQAGALTSTFCSGSSTDYAAQTSTVRAMLTKSQCFIATAAFRSDESPAVRLLRRFRDEVLASFSVGAALINVYYSISPVLADFIVDHPALRIPVLVILVPFQIWAWLALHGAGTALGLILISVFWATGGRRWIAGCFAISLMFSWGLSAQARADESGSLIERIRRESPVAEPSGSHQPFIDRKKKEMGSAESEGSLIEAVRRENPSTEAPEGLIEREKKRLQDIPEPESAIRAAREGRSELHPKKAPREGGAFGFTVSVSQSRNLQADSSASYRSFESVYGSSYAPDIQVFYEYQPFHGEWLGSFGFFGQVGASWKVAKGNFEFAPVRPGGGNFALESTTQFTFLTLPVAAGGVYRLSLLRVLRPYLKAGAVLIGYVEARSDERSNLRGNSRGVLSGAGVAIPLDFLNEQGSWSLYEAQGIRRSSLTLDYQRIDTLSGALDFAVSGLSLGFLFEL